MPPLCWPQAQTYRIGGAKLLSKGGGLTLLCKAKTPCQKASKKAFVAEQRLCSKPIKQHVVSLFFHHCGEGGLRSIYISFFQKKRGGCLELEIDLFLITYFFELVYTISIKVVPRKTQISVCVFWQCIHYIYQVFCLIRAKVITIQKQHSERR